MATYSDYKKLTTMYIRDLKSLDEVQALLDTFPNFYFKRYNKTPLENFIISVIGINTPYSLNHKKRTYAVFEDKEVLVCGTYRYRSLTDIYLLCRNYYPSISIYDVTDVLNKFHPHYCSVVKKRVFSTIFSYSRNVRCEYNLPFPYPKRTVEKNKEQVILNK